VVEFTDSYLLAGLMILSMLFNGGKEYGSDGKIYTVNEDYAHSDRVCSLIKKTVWWRPAEKEWLDRTIQLSTYSIHG